MYLRDDIVTTLKLRKPRFLNSTAAIRSAGKNGKLVLARCGTLEDGVTWYPNGRGAGSVFISHNDMMSKGKDSALYTTFQGLLPRLKSKKQEDERSGKRGGKRTAANHG